MDSLPQLDNAGSTLAFGLLIIIGVYLIVEWKSYCNQKLEGPVDVSTGLKKEVVKDARDGIDRENKMPTEGSSTVATTTVRKVLSPVIFKPFEVESTIDVSKDSKLIRFKIANCQETGEAQSIGLPIGRHITLQAVIEGTRVMRPYTPCSSPDQRGHFDLLIKSYEFGKMSRHMHTLQPGDVINVRGPIGRFHYYPNKYNTIGLIAGGTGITPCLQVIRHILESDPTDHTSFVLFYQNRTFEDILLKDVLDELQRMHPDRLKIRYFLSNASCKVPRAHNKNVIKGYITKEVLVELMRYPELCQLTCLCGPSGFNTMVRGLLVDELGGVEGETVHVW